MKCFLMTGIATAMLSVACIASVAEAGSLKVSIDLSSQRMTVKENGATLHSWPISSGRSGYRTITGTFTPKWMTRMHYSKKYDDAPMPNSIFFSGGFAIHGTYATGRLGSPASHGCVRLSPGNAKRLYDLVQSHGRGNTTISIYGTARDRAPVVAERQRSRSNRYESRDGYDDDYVTSRSSVSSRSMYGSQAKRRNRYADETSRRSRSGSPKVIYRNGVPYVYVGREAARRYYSRAGYSGYSY